VMSRSPARASPPEAGRYRRSPRPLLRPSPRTPGEDAVEQL
jgi:hypothetical protein